LAIPVILIGCFLLFVLMYLTNIDTSLFKITMHGTVTDGLTQDPVSFAKILINGEEAGSSDTSGNYSISNLNQEIAEVKVQADGYDELTQQVAINRGFLAYSFKQDFVLTSSAKATITGKLIPNATYDFSGDSIILNDKSYKLKADGTFEITDIKTGTLHFQYSSMSFKDVDKTYVIKAGTNKIQDIVLEPAGDITGVLKSYVSEVLVLGAQFNIENVAANQVKISDDGKFVIQDLDVDKKYKIKVVAQGYKTRDYEINIVQGENKIFDFRLVEDSSIGFLRKVSNKTQLFVSDLDGVNSEQVTNVGITNFSPASYYINNDENILYFLSDYEHLNGAKSNIKVAYSVNLSDNSQTTLTTNKSTLYNVSANFRAKKLINIADTNTFGNTSENLQVYDLNGNSKKDIKTLNNAQFTTAFLSDSGNFIFFIENDAANAGYYRVDTSTSESKTISQVQDLKPYDATKNGEKTLFARKNSATGFYDLALYTFINNETRILDENLDGFDYQFIKGSDDQILYFATRGGKSDIYKFTISQNKDEKLTNLTSEDKILDIFQSGPEGNFVYYYTNKGLYVMNIQKPVSFKLVTSDVVLPAAAQ